MPNPNFRGYLNDPYLTGSYAADEAYHSFGMRVGRLIVDSPKPIGSQVLRQIVDSNKPIGSQVNRHIADSEPLGLQVDRYIVDRLNPVGMEVLRQIIDITKISGMEVQTVISASKVLGMEVSRITSVDNDNGMEVTRISADNLKHTAMQVELVVTSSKSIGVQVERIIANYTNSTAVEVSRIIFTDDPIAMEIRRDKTFPHWLCDELGYLNQSYLTTSYLARGYCVQGPMQVERTINYYEPVGMEILRSVNNQKPVGMEVERVIADFLKSTAMEVDMLRSTFMAMQVRVVLYNITQLRVMCDFPSRGTSGTNWSATSTEAGDFSVNNLNTDIVEQVWRSTLGTTSVTLTSDTQVVQGVGVDTVAILNHNLTTSANITVEASNSPIFSPVGDTFNITATDENAYYIAPTYPTEQFRYWRFIITDPTNPDGFLQIGTIVFGSTIIMQGECFVDEVERSLKHFSDKVPTEGFTNVSNDRALKTAVTLTFRNLIYSRGNYKNLRNVFKFARTSLKCLWIPDPRQVDRFTVFAKLVTIPTERHKNMGPDAADTVGFTLDLDESL